MTLRQQVLREQGRVLREASAGDAEWESSFAQFVAGFDRAVELIGSMMDELPGSSARGYEALFAQAGYAEAREHAEIALEALRP